jgi:hypothetical protein
MYPLEVIAGMVILLLALFAAVAWIAMPRARRSAKNPHFAAEFLDELNRLDGTREEDRREDETSQSDTSQLEELPQKSAYALYQRGEPAFRIASTLGITRADAELLIRIEESLRRNSTE